MEGREIRTLEVRLARIIRNLQLAAEARTETSRLRRELEAERERMWAQVRRLREQNMAKLAAFLESQLAHRLDPGVVSLSAYRLKRMTTPPSPRRRDARRRQRVRPLAGA